MGEHLAEYVMFGIFFSIVAWLQALWAMGVMIRPTRWLWMAGLIGNAVVVVVWIVSRTSGLPLGPDPGVAEPASFVDVLSTILEVALVAGATAMLARGGLARSQAGRSAPIVSLILVLALALLTTWAIAADAGSGDVHGGAEEHEMARSEGHPQSPGHDDIVTWADHPAAERSRI